MGGTAKKNLRVFREICGDKNLDHVRIVTTNWNLVDEKQGNSRQNALAKGVLEPLIKEGAYLCPHDKGLESALSIMMQLIHQTPVTMKIQEELNEGCTLGDTSAGAMIIQEIKELKEKHDKEVKGLRKEMEEALIANDEELRLELAEECRKLEEMMVRADGDRKTLRKMRKPRRETQPMVDAAPKPEFISDLSQMRRANRAATTSSSTAVESDVGVRKKARGERKVRDQASTTLKAAGTAIAAVLETGVAVIDSVIHHAQALLQ